MKRRVIFKKTSLLLLVLLLTCLVIPSTFSASSIVDINYEITAGEYQLEPTGGDSYQIQMSGPDYNPLTDSPGDPQLPQRIIQFAVAPDTDLTNLQLTITDQDDTTLPESYDIIPQTPSVCPDGGVDWGQGKTIAAGRNLNVYGADSYFPQEAIQLLPAVTKKVRDPEASSAGKTVYKLVKYIRVAYRPFLYNPVQQRLKLIKRAKIWLSTTGSTPIPIVTKLWHTILKAGFPSSVAEASGNGQYVIITTNNIVNNSTRLADFVRLKQLNGHPVRVVTENDFGTINAPAPNGTAEKIRQWIKNNYQSLNIDYVLLIGNPDPDDPLSATDTVGDIPMKMCYPRYYEIDYQQSPTDYYYADLTGNWNADGDDVYGVLVAQNNGTSPDKAIGPDTFSARWTGKVNCDFNENYRFSTYSDDGIRVYIDNNLVIDNWTDHLPTADNSGSINLTSGLHEITVEYRENTGQAVAKLYWETLVPDTNPHYIKRTIVPKDHLYYVDSKTKKDAAGGLNATYYDNDNLSGTNITRIDPQINFIWGTGDLGNGGPETGAEVFVGRIPVYNNNFSVLDRILGKIIDYETDPGNLNWRRKILLPMKPMDKNTPNWHLGEAIINDFANTAGFTSYRIYEADYSPTGGPTPENWPCNFNNVVNEWQNTYGMVTWATHGSATSAASVVDTANVPLLSDTAPSFTFQASCNNGSPENTNNLGYFLLRNGGIATISASRVSWYNGGSKVVINNSTNDCNQCLAYAYTRRIVANTEAGEALAATKGDIPTMTMNLMDYNLYGDPECQLLTTQANQRPVAQLNGPYIADEATVITFDASSSSDPEGDSLEYRWDLNNDGIWDTAWSATATHQYIKYDDYSGSVKVQVRDRLGLTGETTESVEFENVEPTVVAGADQTTSEGTTVNFNGSFSDPGADTWRYEWDFGDGSAKVSGTATTTTGDLKASHTYGDNGTYMVTLTVTDDDGGTNQDFLQVEVKNVAPTVKIESMNQPNQYIIVPGHKLTLTGSFTDPGWLDKHTSTWDFGDGTTAAGTLNEENSEPDATGTSTIEKSYTKPGIYTIKLTIKDDEGESGQDSIQVTVIANLHATVSLTIADNNKIYTPFAYGGQACELGAYSLLKLDNLIVNGDLVLRSWAKVDGDVEISGSIQPQDGAKITGTKKERVPVTTGTITTKPCTYGTDDLTINNDDKTGVWKPGNYRDGMVRARSQVTLTAGTYNFLNLTLEPDSTVVLNTTGGPIYINVEGELHFCDRSVRIINNDPKLVFFYTNSAGTFRIGTDNQLFAGTLIAPRATIIINSRSTINGILCGGVIRVEPNCTINCSL